MLGEVKVTCLLPDPSALYPGSTAILEARAEEGLDTNVPYPGLPHDGDWEAALMGQALQIRIANKYPVSEPHLRPLPPKRETTTSDL